MVDNLKSLKAGSVAYYDKAEGFGITQAADPSSDRDFFV